MEKTIDELVKEVLANAKRGEPEIKIRESRPSSHRSMKNLRKRDSDLLEVLAYIESYWAKPGFKEAIGGIVAAARNEETNPSSPKSISR